MGTLFKLAATLPLSVLNAIGYAVYVLAFHVLRWRRRLATTNINNAFPELSAAERARILRQSYRNLGRTLAEALWGWGASSEALTARVSYANPELVLRYTGHGQSVVLVTAHYANWEWLILTAGAVLAMPIDVVYKPQRLVGVDEYLRVARSRFGANPIPHKAFMSELMKRRGEARAYALVADHTPMQKDEKHWTQFLHQDTAFFVGADKIARMLKAPVIYVAMRREGPGKFSVGFELLAEPPYERGGGSDIVERYVRALEREIRRSPEDWMWLHNKWKYMKPLYSA